MVQGKLKAHGTLNMVNGSRRLQAMINTGGRVQVVDGDSGERFHVHDVGDKLLAVSERSHAIIEDLVGLIVNRACR